jgi:ATP-dependent Clp protease ATP-binding subunit ClpB
MQNQKLTYKSQESLAKAVKIALQNNNSEVTDLHLLLTMLIDSGGLPAEILHKLNVQLPKLIAEIEKRIDKLPTLGKVSKPRPSKKLKIILKNAEEWKKKLDDLFLSREHLMLALTCVECQTYDILTKYNVNEKKLKEVIKMVRGSQHADSQTAEEKYQVLKKYTLNLTKKARQGKLDPVIGRNNEIRRVMQVIARRTKNNPVLIGDPGVGKTAIVEGLASRIADGDVPDTLKEKQLLMLDLASILAGSKFRGEFEERLKALLKKIKSENDKYILFIDEVHTLVGAGAAEGAVDASNMLKPALARGELRAIGATTVEEYRKYIEKDAALERRFQPVFIEEPSVEDTIAILRGLKERYELFHGISIRDQAIVAAAELSDRYIRDRFLPDKAIDLIDEAASALKIEMESMPSELDQLKREITQLEIELEALKNQKGKKVSERNELLKNKLANKKESAKELEFSWNNQKELMSKVRQTRKKIDDLRVKLEQAERDANLDQAAEIKYGKIPELQDKLNKLVEKWERIPVEERILREEVTEEEIAEVVSRWTGIPVAKLLKSEAQKLANLEEEIHKRVVNQTQAVKEVSNAIRRVRTGVAEEDRPIGSFIFVGPTGVGKTELSKALAEVLFDNDEAMIRIDMSEYQERHTVARLIGSPPGYVGHEEGGQLTELVRRKPYTVILLDEIEKAHDDVFNILLQVLDDGRLTDGKGRTVDFRHSIIIMTSNLGSEKIDVEKGKITALTKKTIMDEVKKSFRPEFINRLDKIILFNPLTEQDLKKIVDLQLQKVKKRIKKQDLFLEVTDKAKILLANKGFDPTFGARPLKRVIQEQILDELSLKLVEGKINEGDKITAIVEDQEISLK